MNSADTVSSYKKIEWWVRLYSYITFAGILYGIAAAHLPALFGTPWSSCEFCNCKLACNLVFHLYEVPIVGYNLFFAWFGIKRFSSGTIHNYNSLLTFAIVANACFFTFESILLLGNVQKNAPAWENVALCSVALILAGGAGFGIYVKQKLISYVYQPGK